MCVYVSNRSYIGFKLSVSFRMLILLLDFFNFLMKNISAISLLFLFLSLCNMSGLSQSNSWLNDNWWLVTTNWLPDEFFMLLLHLRFNVLFSLSNINTHTHTRTHARTHTHTHTHTQFLQLILYTISVFWHSICL